MTIHITRTYTGAIVFSALVCAVAFLALSSFVFAAIVITSAPPTIVDASFTPTIGPVLSLGETAYLGRTTTYVGPPIGVPGDTIKWRVTIDGPLPLTPDMVDLDEVGFNDPGGAGIVLGTYHYPFAAGIDTLVATGSCDVADLHDNNCAALVGFSLDEDDVFSNADKLVFNPTAPAGIYSILYELFDTSDETVLGSYEVEVSVPPPADACDTPLVAPAGFILVNGTAGNDNLALAPYTMFVGLGGNDKLRAGSGEYVICLGSGKDVVTLFGTSTVTIDAGDGNNTVTGLVNVVGTILAGTGNDKLVFGSGEREIDAGNGNNVITSLGSGNQTITTGSGNDKITTGSGNDTISVGNGKNTVVSNGGDDSLSGGADKDVFVAGPGTDTCAPGGGTNTLVGCEL